MIGEDADAGLVVRFLPDAAQYAVPHLVSPAEIVDEGRGAIRFVGRTDRVHVTQVYVVQIVVKVPVADEECASLFVQHIIGDVGEP